MVSTRMILLLFSMGNIVTAVDPSTKRKVIEISPSKSDDITVLDGEKSKTNTYIQGEEEIELRDKDPKKRKVDVSDNMAISEQQDSHHEQQDQGKISLKKIVAPTPTLERRGDSPRLPSSTSKTTDHDLLRHDVSSQLLDSLDIEGLISAMKSLTIQDNRAPMVENRLEKRPIKRVFLQKSQRRQESQLDWPRDFLNEEELMKQAKQMTKPEPVDDSINLSNTNEEPTANDKMKKRRRIQKLDYFFRQWERELEDAGESVPENWKKLFNTWLYNQQKFIRWQQQFSEEELTKQAVAGKTIQERPITKPTADSIQFLVNEEKELAKQNVAPGEQKERKGQVHAIREQMRRRKIQMDLN